MPNEPLPPRGRRLFRSLGRGDFRPGLGDLPAQLKVVVGVWWPSGAGDEAWGIAPRRYPSDATIYAHHTAAFCGPRGVILVDGVVVRAQGDQIFLVGGPAGGPRGEVMDLGVVGRRIAPRPGAHGMLGRGEHALFPCGHALGAIQVYRAVFGVNKTDVAALSPSAATSVLFTPNTAR